MSKESEQLRKRAYYLKNREKNIERMRVYYQGNKHLWRARDRKIREAAINAYGGKCECCGEDRYEFLALDHINGGGIQHRRELGWSGNSIAKWLMKNDYPKGFRILCHNCNCAIGFYGSCPHQERIIK